VIKYAKYQMIDQGLNGLRTMIKTRACGNDVGSGSGQAKHVFQVNGIVWRLARHKHKTAALFQRDVGCTMDQVRSCSRGNCPKRAIEQGTMTIPSCG